MTSYETSPLKVAAAASLSLMMAACTVAPTPLTDAEIQLRVAKDLGGLTQDQEPIRGPIDLYEAMARALKYNLDTRVEVMEKMLAHSQLNLSHYSLLPSVVAGGGYDNRSNFSGGSSQSLLTGLQSLEPSTGSEKEVFTADLTLSWDVLDFGLSYVRAQQAADDVLIAEEEKRRVAIRVMQDVRAAYWRAVTAERLMGRLRVLDDSITKALENSETIQRRKLESPISQLRYRRALLNSQREIQQLYRELSTAKIQLAALMNLPPGQYYELVIPDREWKFPEMKQTLEELEYSALVNRPELRTVDYRKRINAKETKAAILQMLPNLNLQAGGNYSSNRFLFNNHWLAYGAKVSWNLVNVFKQAAKLKTIEVQEKVLDMQRLALTMTIMTQVHVRLAQLAFAERELTTAQQYYETQHELADQVRRSWLINGSDEQTMISEKVNDAVAALRYDRARAHLEAAYANLLAAIGDDPLPEAITEQGVAGLAREIRAHWESLLSASQRTVGGANGADRANAKRENDRGGDSPHTSPDPAKVQHSQLSLQPITGGRAGEGTRHGGRR